MKYCKFCSREYSDEVDVCPTCKESLVVVLCKKNQSKEIREEQLVNEEKISFSDQIIDYSSNDRNESKNSSVINEIPQKSQFIARDGNRVVIKGVAVEVRNEQYYQSRFTKIINAVFRGEPYQLEHTTFVSFIRIDEKTLFEYPDESVDVIVYGNMNNIIVSGDEVEVRTIRRGNRYIVDTLFNHRINRAVSIEKGISPNVFRIGGIIILALLAALLYKILTFDYVSFGTMLLNKVGLLLIVVIGGCFIIRSLFGRRRRRW